MRDCRERPLALGDLGDPAEVARRAAPIAAATPTRGAEARVDLRADQAATSALSMPRSREPARLALDVDDARLVAELARVAADWTASPNRPMVSTRPRSLACAPDQTRPCATASIFSGVVLRAGATRVMKSSRCGRPSSGPCRPGADRAARAGRRRCAARSCRRRRWTPSLAIVGRRLAAARRRRSSR